VLHDIGFILAGLAVLIAGGQLLVKGASRLALALGIAPLIVGLTIVAFGTSAPEIAVAIQSSLAGKTDLLLGNAVGSNIYNVLFILGVCATITPLAVAPRLIRLDVPIMVGAALTLLLMAQDGALNRLDGSILIGALLAYTFFVSVQSRNETTRVKDDYADQIDASIHPDRRVWSHGVFLLAGLAMLGLGSELLIRGAVAIAQALGVTEVIIGMTVVTIGTTAPELSACLVAAWKGERDIAVGNIVGSNLFNILAVLGVGALVAPQGIDVGSRMLSVNFVRPIRADGRDLRARARVFQRGQTFTVAGAEVFNADGKTVATASSSSILLPGRPYPDPRDILGEFPIAAASSSFES
jgi:cation:H+ antiporter